MKKDVPNWEGYYQVDDEGNVYTVGHYIKVTTATKTYDRWVRPRKLKAGRGSRDFWFVVLCRVEIRETWSVHRLMAVTFLGLNDEDTSKVIIHNDGDGFNNKLSNLRIATRSDVLNISFANGREAKSGKDHYFYYIDEAFEQKALLLLLEGKTAVEVGKELNSTGVSICRIAKKHGLVPKIVYIPKDEK